MGMAQCLDVKSVDMENYAVNLGLSRITQNGHTSIQKLHYSRSTACLSQTQQVIILHTIASRLDFGMHFVDLIRAILCCDTPIVKS